MVLTEFRTDLGFQVYDGPLNKDSVPHGTGTLYFPSGGVEYEGQFKNGRYHGHGVLYFNSGRFDKNLLRYSGQFRNGMMWGTGRKFCCARFFDDEDETFYYTEFGHQLEFQGNFKENSPHGHAIQFNENNTWRYSGNFKKGLYHGSGILFHNGVPIYHGDWRNNKRHGIGQSYENGILIFSGSWRNNEKDLTNERQSNALKLFLETDHAKHIEKLPLRFLRQYLEKTYQEKNKEWKRHQVVEKLKEKYHEHQKATEDELETEDLFGNEIVIPCYGSDGGIYDISSMRYLFHRNDENEYTNIPYFYDASDVRTPNYRRMKDGLVLSHYSCPLLEEWDVN